jgi:hypothetical protein
LAEDPRAFRPLDKIFVTVPASRTKDFLNEIINFAGKEKIEFKTGPFPKGGRVVKGFTLNVTAAISNEIVAINPSINLRIKNSVANLSFGRAPRAKLSLGDQPEIQGENGGNRAVLRAEVSTRMLDSRQLRHCGHRGRARRQRNRLENSSLESRVRHCRGRPRLSQQHGKSLLGRGS